VILELGRHLMPDSIRLIPEPSVTKSITDRDKT